MRIYCVIDSLRDGWCWGTTVAEIRRCLPKHEIHVTAKPRVSEAKGFDLIWLRGYPTLFRRAPEAHVPIVWTFSTGGARAEALLVRCRPFLKWNATVVVQNRAMEKFLRKAGAAHVVQIPNGVDGERFRPADPAPDRFRVGLAANVNAERWRNKGADVVVEACRKLGVELVLATKPRKGRPSPAPEFDVGRVDSEDMPGFYQGLSVYAQPSIAEGCSNSIMEAMACGVPCVICRESGYHGEACQNFLDTTDGEVLLIDPDDVESIGAAILYLQRHPDRALRIGQNARAFALNHGWARCAAAYEAAFAETLERARAFHLVTVASNGYEDCVRAMAASWAENSGAASITVFSPKPIVGLPHGVKVLTDVPFSSGWIGGVQQKAQVLSRLARELPDGDRVVFLDADCLVMRPLHEFVSGPEDLALTRLAVDPAKYPRCAGTCSSGAMGFKVNDRTQRFLHLWAEVQLAYADHDHGTRPNKVACDQYALTDIARGRACGVTIRALDERVWNSAPNLLDDAWLREIREQRPAVLHFKGGRWRDEKLVRRAIEAANAKVHGTRGERVP